ncbi:MAG: outer membrane lipoprotein carrier protein LolA [Candidatus Poribacteria bacterium]|nr:outer membrane lipoprotein carrier protein LolA [Candidatus Poribacteria bacterium]
MKRAGFGVCAAALIGMLSVTAHGQTAASVFQNFQKSYANVKSISADFQETTIMDGQKRTAKGHLQFQKPNLLRQEYLDETDPTVTTQLIVLDGEMSWSYTPWLNQVTRKRLNPKTSQEILPGAGKNFENIPANYDLALKQDAMAAEKGIHLLEMRPKPGPDGAVIGEYLEVWIRAEDWVPVQFSYTNVENDVVTIVRLEKLNLKATPKKGAFSFEPPRGVEIITITDDYLNDE